MALIWHAMQWMGAPYVFGAEVDMGKSAEEQLADGIDCSEVVQWAAAQCGIPCPDGSWRQWDECRLHRSAASWINGEFPPAGWLLFNFRDDSGSWVIPTGSRPPKAHVAISLGDNWVIEAAPPRVRTRESDISEWNLTGTLLGVG